jgi:hypothetical protein
MTSRSSTCRLAGTPTAAASREPARPASATAMSRSILVSGGLAPVPDGQARDLLGERRALAAGDRAEEPADDQADHHPAAADGGVGQPPAVPAVHPG